MPHHSGSKRKKATRKRASWSSKRKKAAPKRKRASWSSKRKKR
jgi:hypothetical protein